MKLKIKTSGYLFAILLLLLSCKEKSTEPESGLIVKPTVKISTTNYSSALFNSTFPDTVSLNRISHAYSNDFSEETKAKFAAYMKSEVLKLGGDLGSFESALYKSGCFSSQMPVLPTYAEQAKYENKNVWIIQYTRSQGGSGFGHYHFFAIGLEKLDTLAWGSCY